jgi:hypothetical protein
MEANEAPTPTATLIGKSLDKAMATDARGRVITVRKLNALQYYLLTKAMGADAGNAATMDLAMIASAVCRIDILDIAAPLKETDVRALIQQLDFDGLQAAGEALRQLNARADDGVEAAKN